MRPTRIIVGEVRAAECLDLLLALNAGLPGLATIHANSAREAQTDEAWPECENDNGGQHQEHDGDQHLFRALRMENHE